MADAVAAGLDTRFKISAKLSTGKQLDSRTCISASCSSGSSHVQQLMLAKYRCLCSVQGFMPG